jgi:hypothetical protein
MCAEGAHQTRFWSTWNSHMPSMLLELQLQSTLLRAFYELQGHDTCLIGKLIIQKL